MGLTKEANPGITRIGIGDWLRTSCESIESSSLSFRTYKRENIDMSKFNNIWEA